MRNFRLDDESGHQEALFSWAAYRTEIMPELQYMYHVPNGGKRDKATAAVLKRQGVKAGVPDIMLPAARAGYHGLYIELKAGENTTTKKQKADIHHYFQSIDHAVLKTEIRKVIKDAGVLALLDRIIDHNGNMPDGVGIPVGNLTSQLFANIYLDALDQFIKHELGVEAYIRYMDDFVILSPDKEQLRNWLARIEQFLREELKLEFNPKTTILAAKNGIDFVGYKHRATHRKVRKDSIKRIKRTIKKCESGKITKEQLQKSIQSWTGHAGHADSYNLRKKIETLAEAAIEKAA